MQYDSNAYDGYTLFTPERSTSVYLINNCGNVINTWTFSENPGLTCYLLENGNLLRAGKDNLEIRDWDSNLVWQLDLNALGLNQHHDIEPLPNGNILCLVKDIVTETEQINLGKNPALLDGDLRSEKLIEFQPIGTNQANIVWEWRFIDHIIQDFNSNAPNYGDVTAHPELVDFNYEDYNMKHADWLHMNSVDYNADLDQIILSAKSMGEIYIIDHSTTTAEAAGHNGGNSGKGGDILWRWGNPEAYRQGTSTDRKLFEQHDAKWVENGYQNQGKISVFNNDQNGTQTHSSIHLITPELDANNNYLLSNNTFLPTDYSWSWDGKVLGETVAEFKKCGVQSLPNGNIMFCETTKGRLTELDENGNIVWVYRNPTGLMTYSQFTSAQDIKVGNSIFRGEKYPKNHPAFTGKNLRPKPIIEDINANSEQCTESLSAPTLNYNKHISINNPVYNNTLHFHNSLQNSNITIYSLTGKIINTYSSFNGKDLKISNINPGLYFIKVSNNSNHQVLKIVVR